MSGSDHGPNLGQRLALSCPCVRKTIVANAGKDDEYVDLFEALDDDEFLKRDWKWLSLRCERRLNERLKFAKPKHGPTTPHAEEACGSQFVPFVPKLLVSTSTWASHALEPGQVTFRDGALVFCDVSGFTRLAESIERSGDPEAAATLGKCLNTFFDPLIRLVDFWGGDVLKFSGDALLAGWIIDDTGAGNSKGDVKGAAGLTGGSAADDSDDLKLGACLRASKCCLELHKMLNEYPIGFQQERLSMHIGVGFGELAISHVGGLLGRWEFIIGGTPLKEIAIAEPLAMSGQTVISSSVHSILLQAQQRHPGSSLLQVEPTANPDFYVLTFLDDDACFDALQLSIRGSGAAPLISTPSPPPQLLFLKRYIPSYIYAKLSSGYLDFNNEMRRLCTVFVSIPGLDPSDPVGALLAHKLVLQCQKAAYAVEGNVNKVLVDDKGALVLIFMGLPPVHHHDDPVRAVFVALKVASVCKRLEMQVGVGVASGSVWCGVLGNELRREYTALGDSVNLAARLMSFAAQDHAHDIYIDENTYIESRHVLEYKQLDSVIVKGKGGQCKCFTPTGALQLHRQHTLRFKSPLETWPRWRVANDVISHLASDRKKFGGVAVVTGHLGSGTDDLQAILHRHLQSQMGWTCFSLYTSSSGPSALNGGTAQTCSDSATSVDPNSAWRLLCSGLVTKWSHSEARGRIFSSGSGKVFKSEKLVRKNSVLDLVKELLDPSLHWRIGAIKGLIPGLAECSLDAMVRGCIYASHENNQLCSKGQWSNFYKFLEAPSASENSKECFKRLKTLNDFEKTLLEQDLCNERLGPFLASLIEGYANFEPLAIILNTRAGSLVSSDMDLSSWQVILDIANMAYKRAKHLEALCASGDVSRTRLMRMAPVVLVVISPKHCWTGEVPRKLSRLAAEFNACFTIPKLSREEVVDFLGHCLDLSGVAVGGFGNLRAANAPGEATSSSVGGDTSSGSDKGGNSGGEGTSGLGCGATSANTAATTTTTTTAATRAAIATARDVAGTLESAGGPSRASDTTGGNSTTTGTNKSANATENSRGAGGAKESSLGATATFSSANKGCAATSQVTADYYYYNYENSPLDQLANYLQRATFGMPSFIYKTLQHLQELNRIHLEPLNPREGTFGNTAPMRDAASTDDDDNNNHQGANRLVSVQLDDWEEIEIISEINEYATSVLEALGPDQLFVAKVASVLTDEFDKRQLLGPNPREFTSDKFDTLLDALVSRQLLQVVSKAQGDANTPCSYSLASIAIAKAVKHRILAEELQWLTKTFGTS